MQSLIDDERYDEAVSRCSALADRGLVFPQVWLGWMHLTGRGVQQNLTTAEDWFSRAAKQGSPHGQYWLGYICRVQHRLAEARYWLEEAAAQGDSPSIYEMGRLYLFGEGVQRNREKAFLYFREAAKRGHLFARGEIARELISGRRGIRKIPAGIVEMLKVVGAAIRMGPKAEEMRRQ